MFIQGEKILNAKLKDIFQRLYKQINSIDPTQIKALTCGQVVGIDTGSEEYEFLSTCIDQFFSSNYLTSAQKLVERSFLEKYVKEVNNLRTK